MEEDLKNYLDWITQAEDLGSRSNYTHMRELPLPNHQQSINVDVGKHKGDPVVMGLLKSTMFPLQQVLEGIKRRETVVFFGSFEFELFNTHTRVGCLTVNIN